jgi:hypothetical protein
MSKKPLRHNVASHHRQGGIYQPAFHLPLSASVITSVSAPLASWTTDRKSKRFSDTDNVNFLTPTQA